MRKILVTLLIVIAIAAAGFSIWALLTEHDELEANTIYDAIPLDAGLIIVLRDYGEFCRSLRDNDLWNVLNEIHSIGAFSDEMLLIDSLLCNYEQTAPFKGNIIFSFHPVGKDEVYSVGYVKINSDKEVQSLIDLLKQQLVGKAIVSQLNYDNVIITDVAFNDKNRQSLNFSFAYRGGIFVFSRWTILLQNAIRQIKADSNITDQGTLSALIRSAGKNATANIYINYSQMPRTAKTVLHTRQREHIDAIARFADWTELDLNVKSDLIMFNGFTECTDVTTQWFGTLVSQPAMPIAITDAMPTTTYSYLWLGIKRLEQYFSDYGQYLEMNKETERKKELDRLKTSFQIDLQKDLVANFEDEIALVYANVGQTQKKVEPFVLFRIKSTLSAESMINEWHEQLKKREHRGTEKTSLAIDQQLTYTAYQLPFDCPMLLFGAIFAGNNQWCVVADNYLLFGSSPTNLQKYLHYMALQATLQTNVDYVKLNTVFSSRANLMFYGNPAQMDGFFENVLNDDFYKEIEQASGVRSKTQAIVFQLNSVGGKMYNNILLKYSSVADTPVTVGKTQTSWESLLDTAISFKPQLIKNHNTGENDIFVQDMANNAYLLNNVGRIIWKIKLPEAIISPIHQIDIYNNGKLQMFFNTRNYLYVIDRLGNFVDKYPVKLKSPAVGSVALFDYDNNRQYRMMLACEDRKVYLYEKTGKLVDGWSFNQSEHPVQTDIYHFRTGNKDYIVFADKYRVYILDRQGRTRVSPSYNFPVGRHTAIALEQQSSRILLTDTVGTIHFISLQNGNITQQKIKPFPSSHFFAFQDVDNDRQGDFIFTSGNKLEVYRQNAKQIIDIKTDEPISMRPYIYDFGGGDLRIGIVQPQNNQILLFDNKGKQCKEFPLKGSTLFTIGKLGAASGNYNLFVGSKNNFLYNYSVR